MFLAILIPLAFGCGSKSKEPPPSGTDPEPKPAPKSGSGGPVVGDGDCLVGTYVWMDGDAKRSFTFNADKTGTEVFQEGEHRPLTWKIKDASTVHLTYLPHGDTVQSESDFPYNCEKKTVGSIATPYQKQ